MRLVKTACPAAAVVTAAALAGCGGSGHPATHSASAPASASANAGTGARASEVVRISRPADLSPGEIYPSYVDLPKPGCWRLSLAWGSHRAHIDVKVDPS